MKRIKFIASLINSCNNVIDVGSDHCYLAIELLKDHKVKHVTNIEVNQKPLEQGIKHLKKYGLLKNTDNILNDGLKGLENNNNINHTYDYLTIAGMGANNIIEILKYNKLVINTFILQPNNNIHKLRKFLIKNHYNIISEEIINENGIYYPIIIAKKTKLYKIYKQFELYFGKLNNVKNPKLFYQYLNNQLDYLLKSNFYIKKKKIIRLLIKTLNKYESKWDL